MRVECLFIAYVLKNYLTDFVNILRFSLRYRDILDSFQLIHIQFIKNISYPLQAHCPFQPNWSQSEVG